MGKAVELGGQSEVYVVDTKTRGLSPSKSRAGTCLCLVGLGRRHCSLSSMGCCGEQLMKLTSLQETTRMADDTRAVLEVCGDAGAETEAASDRNVRQTPHVYRTTSARSALMVLETGHQAFRQLCRHG